MTGSVAMHQGEKLARMSTELQLVRCTQCGAGLGVVPGAQSVRCGYCRATTAVSGMAQHFAMPAKVAAAEKEGLEALRAALAEKYKPGPLSFVAVFTLWPLSVGMVAATWVQISLALDLPKGLGAGTLVGLIVLLIIVSVVLLLVYYGRTDPRIAQSMADVHASVEREPLPGQCPSCGAPLWMPALTTTLTCCFCKAPLLASEGMLVRWVDSAEERRQAWASQATELLRKVRFQNRVAGCISPVLMLVLLFIGTMLLAAGVAVVRAVLGL